jgi:hypothetical protein
MLAQEAILPLDSDGRLVEFGAPLLVLGPRLRIEQLAGVRDPWLARGRA